jgi:hypothetical protein
MTRKLIFLLLTAALVLSGCHLPAASLGEPHAWIDAPLDGTRLLLQPYLLSFHGGDLGGISRMEVSINGQVLATLPNPDPTKVLVYLTQMWEPREPGRYVIRVRAQNTSGTWSEQDLVTVEVLEDITPTPTQVDTVTPTLVITPTPTQVDTVTPTLVITLTPTLTPTKVPSASASFGRPVPSTDRFEYVYDCIADPLEVTIQVPLINPPQGVKVYFFYRLRNMTTNALTNWNDGLNMTDKGGGIYQVTLSSKSIPDVQAVLHGASAEFQYQFVATGLGVDPLRSPVYSDIQLTTCN